MGSRSATMSNLPANASPTLAIEIFESLQNLDTLLAAIFPLRLTILG